MHGRATGVLSLLSEYIVLPRLRTFLLCPLHKTYSISYKIGAAWHGRFRLLRDVSDYTSCNINSPTWTRNHLDSGRGVALVHGSHSAGSRDIPWRGDIWTDYPWYTWSAIFQLPFSRDKHVRRQLWRIGGGQTTHFSMPHTIYCQSAGMFQSRSGLCFVLLDLEKW